MAADTTDTGSLNVLTTPDVVPDDMGRAAAPDDSGFDAFYLLHFDRLRRVLAVTLADSGLAEEATQEAFYRAYCRWRRVGRMEEPAGWLYRVALNYSRDVLRRETRDRDRLRVVEPAGAPDDAVIRRLEVVQRLQGLPERQRQAVALRYLADLSLAGVAVAMQCAEGTVKATLHQALAHLGVDAAGES